MTKECLKMADVFPSEMRVGGDSDNLIIDDVGIIIGCYSGDKMAEHVLHAINSHDEIAAEVERLRELEADAMRYRKLRECHWNESPICVVVDPKQMVKLGADCPTTTRLDDAIDALIA